MGRYQPSDEFRLQGIEAELRRYGTPEPCIVVHMKNMRVIVEMKLKRRQEKQQQASRKFVSRIGRRAE